MQPTGGRFIYSRTGSELAGLFCINGLHNIHSYLQQRLEVGGSHYVAVVSASHTIGNTTLGHFLSPDPQPSSLISYLIYTIKTKKKV